MILHQNTTTLTKGSIKINRWEKNIPQFTIMSS